MKRACSFQRNFVACHRINLGVARLVVSSGLLGQARGIHAYLRFDDSGERVSAVSGAAGHRQNHSALVRRFGRGVDRLPALLPGGAAAGLSLRPRHRALSEASRADDSAPGPAGRQPARPPHLSRGASQALGDRRSHSRHSGPAGRYRGAALFPAFHHRSAAAGVVRAPLQEQHAVPPVCAFQRRLHVRPHQLSGVVRAGLRRPSAGHQLVGGLRVVHGPVRSDGPPLRQRPAS